MRHKAQIFLLLILILVWVETNDIHQNGIKSRRDERRRGRDTETDEEQDDTIYVDGVDSVRSKAVKIVPAPDLSKSEDEKWKGDSDEDDEVDSELLTEPAKWIQRMIAQVEGGEQDLLRDTDDKSDSREDEMEELVEPEPPRELTPMEKQGKMSS